MLNHDYDKTLSFFTDRVSGALLLKGKWGLERESIRTDSDGNLALTLHPEEFGNKLSNPHITVDFSESQVEMITAPASSLEEAFSQLNALQDYVGARIGDEILWPLSMPPRLPPEAKIPLAVFDESEEGRENSLYRQGLALRYGKKMQMISGIHYNFSLSMDFWDYLFQSLSVSQDKTDFINSAFFAAARNFLRYRWLLTYLFGASPAADDSFFGTIMDFIRVKEYYPAIVSLRMSPLGYLSGKQKNFHIPFTGLKQYTDYLDKALHTNSGDFQRQGLYRDNVRVQLNTRVLQKENEFYAPVRMKSTVKKGMSHLQSLKDNGVAYMEIRTVDINPFYKSGISPEQLAFFHLFMLFCLFSNSPLIGAQEMNMIRENDRRVSLEGRKPGLPILKPGGIREKLEDSAGEILDKLAGIAERLDAIEENGRFTAALSAQTEKVRHPALLPSALIMEEMRKHRETFIDFGLRMAGVHRDGAIRKTGRIMEEVK